MYKEVEKVEGQICLPVEKKKITKVPAFFISRLALHLKYQDTTTR